MTLHRWVHEADSRSRAHYAPPGASPGTFAVCQEARIGPDWSGEIDEFGSPLRIHRCGDCVKGKMADTGEIKMLVRTPFAGMVDAVT